jgi:hypothetical protein
VLVAGRPYPELPDDVPEDHPLRRISPRRLEASAHAGNQSRAARLELAQLLSGPPIQRDILGLIAASGGGLTLSDLGELLQLPLFELSEILSGSFGRTVINRSSLVTVSDHAAEKVVIFAHETLREMAEQQLGSTVLGYRDQLHDWAARYAQLQWPPDTPQYLLRGYQHMLTAVGDRSRLVACATDDLRHERMLTVFHSDGTARAEIVTAQQLLLRTDLPPLYDLARLVDRDSVFVT